MIDLILLGRIFNQAKAAIGTVKNPYSKIGLFGYPGFGCCVLFHERYFVHKRYIDDNSSSSTITGLLYVSVGLFLLFVLIFAFFVTLNRFRRLH